MSANLQVMTLTATVSFSADDFPIADIDNENWQVTEPVLLDRYWNGEPAPESRHCEVRLLWSEAALYVRFEAMQSEPLVVFDHPDVTKKRFGLWERDVCEMFLAPHRSKPDRYAEFEIAPTGEWLDLMVDWTKDEPRNWEYDSGMEPFALAESGKVILARRIPWMAFARIPKAGSVWRGNLFRQIGAGESRGYLAWSPTMTSEPQFHVPEKFGEFEFVR